MTYGRYKQGMLGTGTLAKGLNHLNKSETGSDFDMLPSMDWVEQQPGYRPGRSHAAFTGPSRSYQMGGWVEPVLRAQVTGGDMSPFGISESGLAKWQQRGDYINNWVTDNAQYIADNRDNQEAITSRMWKDFNATGLTPNFSPGTMTQAGVVVDMFNPFGKGGNAYRVHDYLTRGRDPQINKDDAMEGFQSALTANSQPYIDQFTPTVRTQVMKNMLGGMGGDLAGFFSKLLKDGGVGSVGLIAKLIGLFDPNFANYTRGLAGIKQQPVDGSDGGTPNGTA